MTPKPEATAVVRKLFGTDGRKKWNPILLYFAAREDCKVIIFERESSYFWLVEIEIEQTS